MGTGVVRKLAKGAAWLLGGCTLLLAAWFGINATDEPLSDAARATLAIPRPPAPDRDNGFLDFLVLGAPADVPTFEAALERLNAINDQSSGQLAPPPWGNFRSDPRLQRCRFGAAQGESADMPPCFEFATREPWIPAALEAHAALLGRYRAMRAKTRFVSLFEAKSPEDALPSYAEVLEGQRLVLLGAARRFHAGDRGGAVRELERDFAFYRRMAADATTLLDKMIAFVGLDRASLFVAELARRTPRGDAVLWRRLEALLAPLTKAELDVVPSLRREFADVVRWTQTRRYVRLSEASWEILAYSGKTRPWWDPVAPYLYRPHQTVNWFAARCPLFLAVAERPSTEFFQAIEAARARASTLDPGPVARVILNPAGWDHPLVSNCDSSDYIARMHARAGVQTLVRLLVRLHARGITRPEDVASALAGPLGRAHPDPFTGKPMRYDSATRTLGFDAEPKYLSGVARGSRQRYGRMALRL